MSPSPLPLTKEEYDKRCLLSSVSGAAIGAGIALSCAYLAMRKSVTSESANVAFRLIASSLIVLGVGGLVLKRKREVGASVSLEL